MAKVVLVSRDEVLLVGDAEHSYSLRRTSQEILREIRERHTSRVERSGESPRDEIDEAAVQDEVLDYAIQAWTGIELADGTPAPCTAAAKAALPRAEKMRILYNLSAVNLQGDSGADLRPLPLPSAPPAPEVSRTPAA